MVQGATIELLNQDYDYHSVFCNNHDYRLIIFTHIQNVWLLNYLKQDTKNKQTMSNLRFKADPIQNKSIAWCIFTILLSTKIPFLYSLPISIFRFVYQ